MIYAGVDIAKADHVVGAVGETGDEVAKPMPFKNSKEGFERCVAWAREGIAETQDDVVIGMEATGHYWQACFLVPDVLRIPRRRHKPDAGEGGAQAQEPLEGQERPHRQRRHRRDAANRELRRDRARHRRAAVAEDPSRATGSRSKSR